MHDLVLHGQLSPSESMLLKFISDHNLSEEVADELLSIIRNENFRPSDILKGSLRTYKNHIERNIPDHLSFKTEDAHVGMAHESKIPLVDSNGDAIQIVYRDPLPCMMRHYSDASLSGKIYINPKQLFDSKGQRIFSNFGNGK
jgi:hypothetical protein